MSFADEIAQELQGRGLKVERNARIPIRRQPSKCDGSKNCRAETHILGCFRSQKERGATRDLA